MSARDLKLKVWSDVRVRILAAAADVFLTDEQTAALINDTPGRLVTPAAVRSQTTLRGIPRIRTAANPPVPVPEAMSILVSIAQQAEPEYVPRPTWTPEREALLEKYRDGVDSRLLAEEINALDGYKVRVATMRLHATTNLSIYRPVGFSPILRPRKRRLVIPSDLEAYRESAALRLAARAAAVQRRAADREQQREPYVRSNFVAAWLRPHNSGDPFRDAMAKVTACMPKGLDHEAREEIAQDVALAMLEGGEMAIDPRELVRVAVSRYRGQYEDRRTWSLDSIIPGTDSLRVIDTLPAPEPDISIEDAIDLARAAGQFGESLAPDQYR